MKEVKNKLPQGWRWEKLSALRESIEYGYTASANKNPVGPKLLRITDIESGEINWDSVPYCECSEADKKKYRLNDGDIVFARTGSTGNSCLIKSPPEAVFASFLIRIKLNQKLASPEYVLKFFKSPLYWRVMNKQMRGGIQKGFNASMLAEMQVPIPEHTKEQENIAGKLDIKVSQSEKMRQAALKQKEAISAMQGAILREAFPYKEGDKLPQGWKWEPIKDYIEDIITFNKERWEQNRFRYIDISSIDNIKKEIISTSEIDTKDAPSRAKSILKQNDVIISTVRPNLNAVAIVSEEYSGCIGSSGFCVLRAIENHLLPKFLYYYLTSPHFIKKVSDMVQGAMYPAINNSDVVESLIPLPPKIDIQVSLVNNLDNKMLTLENLRQGINKKLEAIEAMQGAILRETFDFKEVNN